MSERIEREVEKLLDEAFVALREGDRATARDRASAALVLDPDNGDTQALIERLGDSGGRGASGPGEAAELSDRASRRLADLLIRLVRGEVGLVIPVERGEASGVAAFAVPLDDGMIHGMWVCTDENMESALLERGFQWVDDGDGWRDFGRLIVIAPDDHGGAHDAAEDIVSTLQDVYGIARSDLDFIVESESPPTTEQPRQDASQFLAIAEVVAARDPAPRHSRRAFVERQPGSRFLADWVSLILPRDPCLQTLSGIWFCGVAEVSHWCCTFALNTARE